MSQKFPFVTIGEGLAAGVGEFALYRESQEASFAARFAASMGRPFPLPLLEPPGLEVVPPGFAQQPMRLPGLLQSKVLDQLPPRLIANLAVPGFTLSDAIHLRPTAPVVQPDDPKLTAANVILGMGSFALNRRPATQLEYALAMRPEMVLVELGYAEACAAAMGAAWPEPVYWGACFDQLLRELGGAKVILTTIPNPFDTAAFSSLDSASDCLRVSTEVLREIYGLSDDHLLTPTALMAMGSHFFGGAAADLPAGCHTTREFAAQVAGRITELNRMIAEAAGRCDARVFDLAAYYSTIQRKGAEVNGRQVTAGYLGGFFGLNGFYPGAVGHALIANELIRWANCTLGGRLPESDVSQAAQSDPVFHYRPARGPHWDWSNLPRPLPRRPEPAKSSGPPPAPASAEATPIQLPASREITLELNPAGSYFGDGIAPLNCRDPKDVPFGTGAHWLFGGLAMVDCHLRGSIRVRFAEPESGKAKFTLSFGDGLAGDDAVLTAPVLFEMPFQQSGVRDAPGTESSGVVDLATGNVESLTVYASFLGTALFALVGANPSFPKQPLSFPGPYGSALGKFESRENGQLDFTFAGTTFVPLGPGIVWPLPFGGPSREFATVPAAGTVMHPHLYLTSKRSDPAAKPSGISLPVNCTREYVLHTHNSAFGDAFHLNAPELGGPATGRSHIMGRLQIQFGPESHGAVPVAFSLLGPGGQFDAPAVSPISLEFPGRLSPGALGYYEMLRFPLRSYALDDLAVITDTFDIPVGRVNLETGRLLHPLLHRGFINQDLIFALLRVEPRTPKSSFLFRGGARFEAGADGQPVFRYEGTVLVPYPEGFLFPRPDLTMAYRIGPNSVLDPFLWTRARPAGVPPGASFEYAKDEVVSSTGDVFSFRVRFGGGREPELTYENLSQQGSFRMHAVTWASLGNSMTGAGKKGPDTLTITGFGVWRKDDRDFVLPVAAQFCTAREAPYVGIQVGGAEVSNVNTKPATEGAAKP